MADHSTSPRRVVALALAAALLFGACSSTETNAATSDAGTPDVEPPQSGAALAFVETEPVYGTIESVAPDPSTPDGPELGASPEELLAWDWGHAQAPIAQFDAFRISGTAELEPAWTGQFLQFSDDEAASCVDGPAYQPIRAAFGESTSATFQVNGELWRFTVLDPRTYPLAVERC